MKRRPEEVVRLAQILKDNGMKLDRFQQVGLIFAHLNLNQTVPAFLTLLDHFGAGLKLTPKASEGISSMLAQQATAVDEAYFLLEQRKPRP